MTSLDSSLLARIWSSIDGDEADLARVRSVAPAEAGSGFSLPLWELAHDSIAAASLQAAVLSAGSGAIHLDADRILTAVTSERHFRQDGEPPQIWADLSGFWRTGDGGWVRTHANYPHHRARLLGAVGLTDATAESFEARIRTLSADEIEVAATAAGALAVRVRTAAEWRSHPVGREIGREPLVSIESGPKAGGDARWAGSAAGTDVARPLSGVRVLDLTRVIAGPVASRTLALFGAEVLRIDSPDLPEPEWQHLDSGAGKRSGLLRLPDESETLHELLADADVVLLGYRPDGLARLGLEPVTLRERYPALIIGRLDAWGWSTQWSDRRGFDSLVQAASGIARETSVDGDRPGALPFQALDHATGYLLATGVMRALQEYRDSRASATVQVSLARTAHELLAAGFEGSAMLPPFEPTTVVMDTTVGQIVSAAPAAAYGDGPAIWPSASRAWGSDRAQWRSV